MFSSKGQTSLEYLTNYGWMLLAVALVGGTLYSQMGGPQCQLHTEGFSTPFPTVSGLHQYENETLAMQVRNPSQEQIMLEEIVIQNEDKTVGVVDVKRVINGEASKNVYTNRFSSSENCITRNVKLKYSSPTLENLTSEGQLIGKLSLVPLRAIFEINPVFADTGEEITFNASGSVGKNNISEYRWTFGDGQNATGKVVTHNYSADGVYSVSLTVEDNKGLTTRKSKQVFIGGLLLERGGVFPQLKVGETLATSCIGDKCAKVEGGDSTSVMSGGGTLKGTLITSEILMPENPLCITSRVAEETDSGCPTVDDGEGTAVTLDNNKIDWIIIPTIKPEDGSLCIGDCK